MHYAKAININFIITFAKVININNWSVVFWSGVPGFDVLL